MWARSSDWESAALARQRPRVQIPVGPFLYVLVSCSFFCGWGVGMYFFCLCSTYMCFCIWCEGNDFEKIIIIIMMVIFFLLFCALVTLLALINQNCVLFWKRVLLNIFVYVMEMYSLFF